MQRNLQCVLAFVLSLGAVAAHGANGYCERLLYARKIPREFGACRIWEESPDNAVIAYEETWGDTPDATQIARLIDTKDAIKKTLQFYATLHAVPQHPLVFVTDEPFDPRRVNPAFEAFNVPTSNEDLGRYCWVGVTPLGYSLSRLEYLQTVAHEMGHCLIDDYVGSVNSAADDGLWFEGIAEYLANQVFVTYDYENEYIVDYDPSRGVVSRPYRNMSFFQYYGNYRGGPRGVLELAKDFAEFESEGDYVSVLGGVPGVEDFWHDFARESTDEQVVDQAPRSTDGVLPAPAVSFLADDLEITLGSGSGEVEIAFDASDDFDLGTADMFTFYIQQFVLTGPGIYRLEPAVTDEGDIRSSFERGSGWNEMTEAITIETCDQLEQVGVLLSLTSTDSVEAKPKIAYSGEPNPRCCVDTGQQDPCLVGAWELDASRLERFVGSQIRSHRRAGDAEAPARGVEGLGWLRADGTGRVTSSMRLVVEVPQGPNSRMSITTESDTDIDRTWSTRDGIFYSCRGEGSTIVLQTTDFRSDNPESGESTEGQTYVKFIDGEVSDTGGNVSMEPPRDADAEERASVRAKESQANRDLQEGGRRSAPPIPGLTAMPGPWDNAGRVPYTCSGDTLVLEMTPETELDTRTRGSFTVPPLLFTLRRTSAPEPPRRAASD